MIVVPSDATENFKKRLRDEILRTFPSLGEEFSLDSPEPSPQERPRPRQPTSRGVSPSALSTIQDVWRSREEDAPSGLKSISTAGYTGRRDTTGYTGEEGTILGSIGEMIENIPRGARLSGLMMLQGIAALPTTHTDTAWEKSLRRKIREIYEDIDPAYAEAHLPQLGMALGQLGGIMGGAGAVGAAGIAAGLSAPAVASLGLVSSMLMGSTMTAGEQAGMIADYEERTGEDVGPSKELMALSLSAGLGLTEAWPMARLGRKITPLLPDIAQRAIQQGVSKRAMREGADALKRTTAQGALSAGKDVLSSALKQAMKEGTQEGLQQFGQSKIAEHLYDDEAMIGAGVEALREALIGGEVGAISDVLLTMATRIYSPGRFNNVAGMRAIEFLDKAIKEGIKSGKFNDPMIRHFAVSQDPAIVEQREKFIRGTAIVEAQRISAEIQDTISESYDRGEITIEQRDKKRKAEQDAIDRAVRAWVVGRAGILEYQRQDQFGAIRRGVTFENLTEKEKMELLRTTGELQRGEPESLMSDYHRVTTGGPMAWAMEHIGDLSNRISPTGGLGRAGVDLGNTLDKIQKTLRELTVPYGYKDPVSLEGESEKLKKKRFAADRKRYEDSGAGFALDQAQLEERMTPEDREKAAEIRRQYAEAHRQLPTYNRVQRLSVEAAVSLAEGRYTDTIDILRQLQGILEARGEEAALEFSPLQEGQVDPSPTAPTDVLSQVDFTGRVESIATRAAQNPLNITEEDAHAVATPNIAGIPIPDSFSPSHILGQIRDALRPRPRHVDEADKIKLKESLEATVELDGRLITSQQRESLMRLSELVEAGNEPLSMSQLREILSDMFDGGVYNLTKQSMVWRDHPDTGPSSLLEIENKAKKNGSREQRANGRKLKNAVLSDIVGFSSLVSIGNSIDEGSSRKPTDIGFEELAGHVSDLDTYKIVQALVDPNNPEIDKISIKFARDALKTRHVNQDLESFAADTLGMDRGDVRWGSLLLSEKQAVMARILRTQIQAVEGARHADVSPVPAQAGQMILSSLATQAKKAPKKRTVYKQFALGTSNNRSKSVQDLTNTINKNLGLNLDVENVVNYIERAADYGLVKYLAPTKRGEYTRVKFLSPEEAVKNIPLITRRQSEINRITEELVDEGVPRSPRQLGQDAKLIANYKERFDRAKEYIINEYAGRGIKEDGLKIAVALDSMYAEIKDIFNDPNVIVDSKMNADGPSASLQNHGTMMVFNLSQMENKYKNKNLPPVEILLEHPALHEGIHLYYLNDVFTNVEQNQINRYGKKQLVPLELLPAEMQAEIDAGTANHPTWRQWVDSIYEGQNKNDLFLEEETAVRILSALMQKKIPKQKSAGFLNKIKNDLNWRAKTIINATEVSDLTAVMGIVEKLQTGEMLKREQRILEGGLDDPSSRVLLHATEDQYNRLMEAARKGTDEQVMAIAREVAASRKDVTPEFDLNESLMNTFRARRMAESTPRGVEPVLNIDAIDRGQIDMRSLNEFFEIEDGKVPPLRMVSEVRESRGDGPVIGGDERLVRRGRKNTHDPKRKTAPGSQVIIAAQGHEILPDGSFVGTFEQMKKLLQYSQKEMMRYNIADDKLPMHKLADAEMQRQVRLYGRALSQLAEISSISAWRFADIASKLLDGVLHDGVPEFKNGGFQIKQSGDGYTQQGLLDVFSSLMDESLGEDQEMRTSEYMRDKRMIEIYDLRANFRLEVTRLERKLKTEKNPARLEVIRDELVNAELYKDMMEELYNRLNPMKAGTRTRIPNMQDAKNDVSDIEKGDTPQRRAIVKFRDDHRRMNKWMIDFAWKTGQITDAQRDLFSQFEHVPFYTKTRKQRGFEHAVMWKNSRNNNIKEQERRRFKGILDESVEGSFEDFTGDLFGDITSNYHTIIRDGMIGVAAGRSMRDAVSLNVATNIGHVPREWEQKRDLLKNLVKKYDGDTRTKENMEARLASINKMISDRKKEIKANEAKSDARGHVKKLYVEVRGAHSPLDERNIDRIRERLASEKGVNLEDITENEILTAIPNERAGEVNINPDSVVMNHGVLHVYRVSDPLLQQSIMNVPFDPMTLIEAGFTKFVGLTGLDGPTSERVGRQLAKISVGASRLLREAVVRTPWFTFKNVPRDSFTAATAFGGGPTLFFKALKKVFDPNTLEQARRYGLTIPPYEYIGSRTDRETQKSLQKAKKRELRSWKNPVDIIPKVWDSLGTLSQKSEVATRLAIHEKLRSEDVSEAEATKQAIEIINYGRRGANPMFGVYSALSPFINGRIQGMDSIARVFLGSWDAPGVVGKVADPTAENEVSYRRGLAIRRSAWIMAGTFMYYLYWFDDEEYKNTPEAIKNDYWLVKNPLGGPSFRVPIPFELGVLFKVIPEQFFRLITESEHDARDVRKELVRQVTGSLDLVAAPQIVRPVIAVLNNKDSYTRRAIVPEWMEDNLLSPQQKTPRTNEAASIIAEFLDKIPLVNSLPYASDMWTSPMKLAYLLQAYTGTMGIYGMAAADKLARTVTGKNRVGTTADFPLWPLGSDSRTWENLPIWGDFFLNTDRGGGFEEDLYDMINDVNVLITTLGRIEKDPDAAGEARKFKRKHRDMLKHGDRLRRLEKRLSDYRSEVEELMSRDIPDQKKRDIYYRKMKGRDRSIKEVKRIMAEIRKDRGFMESLFGREID